MSDALEQLRQQLVALRDRLREHTWRTYKRVNPFVEDLSPWRAKGEFFGGENVTMYDSTTVIGEVRIGDRTWVGPFCMLDGGGGLTIGANCSISTGVQLMSHDTVRWAVSGGAAAYEYAPIRIGDCCFIGTHAVVVKGVTVGEHSVVAAGAVVTKDVAPYSIVAGVPARPIGRVLVDGSDVRFEYGDSVEKSG